MYTLPACHTAAMSRGIPLTQLRAEAVSSLLLTSHGHESLNLILSSFPMDGQEPIFLNY